MVPDATDQTRLEPDRSAHGAPPPGVNIPPTLSDRVLLVEDNAVNQRVTIAMLDHLGFCTDVVDNGVEAVIAATMVPYRAILMDCQIPVLNGYEATLEIRSQWGASRSSPIIAVTASTSDLDRERCTTVGMDGYLAKPLTLESLADGMDRWAPDPSRPAAVPDLVEPDLVTDGETSKGHDTPELPALDSKVIRRLHRLGEAAGEDLLGQLAAVFLPDADARIVAMRQALTREDGPFLIHSAHTLCGASANLGAAALSRLCARMATDGAVVDMASAGALLAAVEAELERVRTALLHPTAPALTLVRSPVLASLPTPMPGL